MSKMDSGSKDSATKNAPVKAEPVVGTEKPTTKKIEAVVEVKKSVIKASPPPEEKKPLVTFARWFNSKKFKHHWAAGMQAYVDTTRRRTMEEWDRLFANY